MALSFELGLRLFWRGADTAMDPGNSKQQALFEAMKLKPKFYRDRFCDSVHQTKLGEQTVASCMAPDFESVLSATQAGENPKILALGASTTHGFNCNSETSWPTELSNLEKKNVINLADDGAYSDESISKLYKEIEKGNKPDMVIWSHGMTEFLFYGDGRDINFSELSKDTELMQRLKGETVYKENFILKVLRFDITLQKYWYGYRFMRVMGNLTAMNLKSGYHKFLMGQTDENLAEMNEREKYLALGGIFSGPVRMIFSQPALDYAIKNYGMNLDRLKIESDKNGFKVMCIKIPNVKGLLEPFSGEFGHAYDSWIDRVNSFTVEKCNQLGFKVADVHSCYVNLAAKDEAK